MSSKRMLSEKPRVEEIKCTYDHLSPHLRAPAGTAGGRSSEAFMLHRSDSEEEGSVPEMRAQRRVFVKALTALLLASADPALAEEVSLVPGHIAWD